jgi:glycosyltransferase involved in cell wall biosynthesis
MAEKRLKVHFTAGDGKGWALDEDLRQIRLALKGMIRETATVEAEVIHAPFWQNLGMVAPEILKRSFVIAHADNPPFFYLKQPEFLAGQQQVDLWVARSREALEQFEALGLPVIHIPYTIDPGLFFPINDKAALRREFGIPEKDYVIANFHRDTEGADLRVPKVQKNPEFMMAILRRLKEGGIPFHVLLAGPRRHWIRASLRAAGIPFTFVGKEVEGDDFGINILDRATLNRLYNAADLYLIPSRWEGGPQSAMEAAACRCKILSVPIGVGRDILEPKSLFRSSTEAMQRLADDIRGGELNSTVQIQSERWKASHTTATLKQGLLKLYRQIPKMEAFRQKHSKHRPLPVLAALSQAVFTVRRRIGRARLPDEVSWNHRNGVDGSLDRIMQSVGKMLGDLGIAIRKEAGAKVEIVGLPEWRVGGATRFQWVIPGTPAAELLVNASLIAPSVQDVVNLRREGCRQPAIVLPVLEPPEKQSTEPFVVHRENREASLQVWKALGEERPVIYPEESAYYEQVFHAGLSYRAGEDPDRVAEQGREIKAEFRELRHIPSLSATRELLQALLLSSRRKY